MDAPEGEEGTPTPEPTLTEGDGGGTPTETDSPEGTETDTPEETGDETETGDGEGTTVGMEAEGDAFYFDPIGLFVEPGTTVTWSNESGSHSSTAYQEGNGPAETTRIPEDAEAWDSGTLSEEGATFEHTFETPGTYDYFCIPHKTLEMVGRVVVGEPGGPAEGSMPPDGDVPESSTIVEQGSVSFEEFSG
jgi:plastocyanin